MKISTTDFPNSIAVSRADPLQQQPGVFPFCGCSPGVSSTFGSLAAAAVIAQGLRVHDRPLPASGHTSKAPRRIQAGACPPTVPAVSAPSCCVANSHKCSDLKQMEIYHRPVLQTTSPVGLADCYPRSKAETTVRLARMLI